MGPKQFLRAIALQFHIFHERAHTFWLVKQSGVKFHKPLNFEERKFYVQLKNELTGHNLVVYDIGASGGTLSSCLAKMPNIAQVHAFEPIPSVFKKLSGRMANYSRVICHNVALGEENREMPMFVMNGALASSSLLEMRELHKSEFSGDFDAREEYVKVIKLDDYVMHKHLPQPHLVKIDVQGYEDRVLRGGKQIIGNALYCMLEMSFEPLYNGAPIFDDIYQLMRGMGFRLIGVSNIAKGRSGKILQVDGTFRNEKFN